MTEMKKIAGNMAHKVFLAAGLAGALIIGGCNGSPHYVDSQAAVSTALNQNNLGDIHVSQDRNKGVMTLTGTVPTDDQKSQAASVAKEAAPTYTIANQIAVMPPENADATEAANSHVDDAIEDNYKAQLKLHRNLDDQSISIDAKNGSVVLTGSVKTREQKSEAEKLAKEVPNVQQVVNEIEVKPNKHSTAK